MLRAPALRLLLLEEAAAYLRVSSWTVRDYVAAGLLSTVSLPALRAREGARQRPTLRRLLFDVHDLDAFIDRAKDASAQVQKTCEPERRPRKTA
jgi:hypothetical protein